MHRLSFKASLNSEALSGPKLQAHMCSILVRFRKDLVALVGDVSQMYHQLSLTVEDRPLYRFLWRNIDQSKEPEVYEFLRYVFAHSMCGRSMGMITKQSIL